VAIVCNVGVVGVLTSQQGYDGGRLSDFSAALLLYFFTFLCRKEG